MFNILVINPGSTSTKIAYYEDEKQIFKENIVHQKSDLSEFKDIPSQLGYRTKLVEDVISNNGVDIHNLSAVVGRGGLVFGLKTGAYEVNDKLIESLKNGGAQTQHASNLGGMIAYNIAKPLGIKAYIYDAVTSGSLDRVAKITGIKCIERKSCCHVLNSRAMAMKYADSIGKSYDELKLIVAHLGGGVSLSAHANGTIIDSVGDDDGPFAPERAGSVPELSLIDLCFSGNYSKSEIRNMIRGKGGLYSHLGTSDCREIEKMIQSNDEYAYIVFKAQAYQIAKAIGLLSVTLKGDIDAIILTGGVAYSKMLTDMIKEYAGFIAPIIIMPGENEMQSLCFGTLRVLRGEEKARIYE